MVFNSNLLNDDLITFYVSEIVRVSEDKVNVTLTKDV